MKNYNKITLLFLKYLPLILLYTCLTKITLFHLFTPIVVKHINVILSILISIGLYFVSYTLKFCNTYRHILGLGMFGYINYEMYLIFGISHCNLISEIYLILYWIVCLGYTFYYKNKCTFK